MVQKKCISIHSSEEKKASIKRIPTPPPAVNQSRAIIIIISLSSLRTRASLNSNLPNLHHLLDRLPTDRAVLVLHLPRTLLTRTQMPTR